MVPVGGARGRERGVAWLSLRRYLLTLQQHVCKVVRLLALEVCKQVTVCSQGPWDLGHRIAPPWWGMDQSSGGSRRRRELEPRIIHADTRMHIFPTLQSPSDNPSDFIVFQHWYRFKLM